MSKTHLPGRHARVPDTLKCAQHTSQESCPVGPLGFNFSQHMPTTRPSVERTAEKAFLLSDRVSLSSAEARSYQVKSTHGGESEKPEY